MIAAALVVSLFLWAVVGLHKRLSPGTASGGTYKDPLGWSIQVPPGWRTTTIHTNDARVSYSGASFSNITLPSPSPNAATPSPSIPDVATLPHDAVVLTITHRDGGPAPDYTQDDSRLPLSPGGLQLVHEQFPGSSEFRALGFVSDGLMFDVGLLSGDRAPPEDLAAARSMIETIRFAPTQIGSWTRERTLVAMNASVVPVREGRYLGPVAASGSTAGHRAFMIIHAPGGLYAFSLPRSARATFTWSKTNRQVAKFLPGSTDPVAVWDRLGRVTAPYRRAGGPRPLSSLHAVTVSWDDHLLLNLNATYDSGLASNYWHS